MVFMSQTLISDSVFYLISQKKKLHDNEYNTFAQQFRQQLASISVKATLDYPPDTQPVGNTLETVTLNRR